MALMATGIVSGQMAWPLVIGGMFLAVGLILVSAPAPMLIAVGMYLPFEATACIFVGGLAKWLFDLFLKQKKATDEDRQRAENMGILISSGFIAGESLMAVILALAVIGGGAFPWILKFQELTFGLGPNAWLGIGAYVIVAVGLVWLPVSKMREGGLPSTHIEH
jgi:hypothetical protein